MVKDSHRLARLFVQDLQKKNSNVFPEILQNRLSKKKLYDSQTQKPYTPNQTSVHFKGTKFCLAGDVISPSVWAKAPRLVSVIGEEAFRSLGGRKEHLEFMIIVIITIISSSSSSSSSRSSSRSSRSRTLSIRY